VGLAPPPAAAAAAPPPAAAAAAAVINASQLPGGAIAAGGLQVEGAGEMGQPGPANHYVLKATADVEEAVGQILELCDKLKVRGLLCVFSTSVSAG
jgi:hypothetical protein